MTYTIDGKEYVQFKIESPYSEDLLSDLERRVKICSGIITECKIKKNFFESMVSLTFLIPEENAYSFSNTTTL